MIYAVIPALNECATIAEIVRDVRDQGLRVVVVDDGSTDGTGEAARAAGAHVIRHDTPQGIGPSLLDGWKWVIEQPYAEALVQLDAGGSHDPCLAWYMAKLADGIDADMVIGSRFVRGAQYIGRGWRSLASQMAAHMLNFAAHSRIHDWTSGYRAYTIPALKKLLEHHYYQKMHAWQIEVLGHAIEDGLKVREIPITYTAGRSSMSVRTAHEAFLEWLWIFNR